MTSPIDKLLPCRDGVIVGNVLLVRIREFFDRKLKCERIGHINKTLIRKGWSKPSRDDWRCYVAMRAEKITSFCPRCGAIHSEEIKASYKGVTGYSWPQSMADEFEEKGFVKS